MSTSNSPIGDPFSVRPFDVLVPRAKGLDEILRPFVRRFEDHPSTLAANDELSLRLGKPDCLRKPHRLAPTVREDFRALAHTESIYTSHDHVVLYTG
jgi:hypothetical protein